MNYTENRTFDEIADQRSRRSAEPDGVVRARRAAGTRAHGEAVAMTEMPAATAAVPRSPSSINRIISRVPGMLA